MKKEKISRRGNILKKQENIRRGSRGKRMKRLWENEKRIIKGVNDCKIKFVNKEKENRNQQHTEKKKEWKWNEEKK